MQPNEQHELIVKQTVVGRYRLIATLMYSGSHFITDVVEQREGAWLRFDGMKCGGIARTTHHTAGGWRPPLLPGASIVRAMSVGYKGQDGEQLLCSPIIAT